MRGIGPLNYLISFALLTLFTSLKLETGVVQIRPFDALVCLMFLSALASARIGIAKYSPSLIVLFPYFIWHVMSASTVNLINGVREGLQICIIALFALILSAQVSRIDYEKCGRIMLLGLSLIVAINIGWHIANGYWFGWKRLNDPKAAFTFLPVVVSCFMAFATGRKRRALIIFWVAFGIILLFSGERKAIIIFCLLSIMIFARGNIMAVVPLIGLVIATMVVLANISDPYVSRQIATIIDPMGSGESIRSVVNGEVPISFSDTQRTFAIRQAWDLVSAHPAFGVGTNAYVDIIRRKFSYLPPYMLVGIHGEFIRILAENGLLGLALYLWIWIYAWIRLRHTLGHLVRRHIIVRRQATLLLIALFIPAVFYLAFEATGSHSFVVLTLISMSPDIVSGALRSRAKVKRGGQRLVRIPRQIDPADSGATVDSSSGAA
jgi:hypothetical protein